jgi:calcium-dependent protein kinase
LSIIKEIEVIRILDHPNLMKIFAVYETKNSIYLVLELLAGGQLFDRISYTRRLRSSEVREIMRSLLNGLDALHERGFMHRDLKPENILFRETGSNSCVIADFGLA